MRKIVFSLLSVFLMISLVGCIRHVPSRPVVDVVKINEKKDELYVKANNWMAEAFNDSKSVIQFRDKKAGVITGKYLLGVISQVDGGYGPRYVYAIIKIQIRDGATRITVKPESFKYDELNPYTQLTQKIVEEKVKNLIESYKNYMKTEASYQKW